MKPSRIILPGAVLFLISCLPFTLSATPPPQTIGYQGYLMDGTGKPVTTRASVTVSLYSISSQTNVPAHRR